MATFDYSNFIYLRRRRRIVDFTWSPGDDNNINDNTYINIVSLTVPVVSSRVIYSSTKRGPIIRLPRSELLVTQPGVELLFSRHPQRPMTMKTNDFTGFRFFYSILIFFFLHLYLTLDTLQYIYNRRRIYFYCNRLVLL